MNRTRPTVSSRAAGLLLAGLATFVTLAGIERLSLQGRPGVAAAPALRDAA